MARKKTQTNVKWLLILIVSLAAAVVMLRLGWSVVNLWGKSKYKPGKHFNLVLVSKPVLIISLNQDQQLTTVALPDKTEVEVPGGYGSYQLQSVFELDSLEKKSGQLYLETAQFFLGVPIDGFWGVDKQLLVGEEDIDKEQLLDFWAKKMTLSQFWQWLGAKRITNLTWIDEWRLFFQLKSIASAEIKFKNFYYDLGLDKSERIDKSLVYKLAGERIDGVLKEMFFEEAVVAENKRIAVLNASGVAGKAGDLARIVKNMGGRVINIDNIESGGVDGDGSGCLIYEAGEKASYTATRLIEVFHCRLKKESLSESRGEITLVINE